MKTTIYALVDPRDGKVCYIGKTKHVLIRLSKHIRRSPFLDSPVAVWIRKLLVLGLNPLLSKIGEYETDGCREEKFFISLARHIGCPLRNVMDGGEADHGDEFRIAKQRLSSTGIIKTKEEIEKRLATLRSKTPEEKALTVARQFAGVSMPSWGDADRMALAQRRMALGVSANKLSRMMKIHPDTISRIERGMQTPRKRTMARIDECLKQIQASGWTAEDADRERDTARLAGLRAKLLGKHQTPEQIRKRKEAFAATMARKKASHPAYQL